MTDCLTDKALEYAARSDNRDNFAALKGELALRFDLKEEPVAARQQLHLAKQGDDETLEAYLQRILAIAMDGYKDASAILLQQMATEAFLRGCRDAATLVMNEAPQTIHVACKRIKTMLANKKAIGGKVSFSERIFTVQETRVSNIEKKVDDLLKTVHRPSTPPRLASPSPPRYSSGYQGQCWQRPRSPDYYRGGSPNGHKYPQRFSPSRQGHTPTEVATHLRATTVGVHPEMIGTVQVWVVSTHLLSILAALDIIQANMVLTQITGIGIPIHQITTVHQVQGTVLLISITLRDTPQGILIPSHIRPHPLGPMGILDLGQVVLHMEGLLLLHQTTVGHKVLKLGFMLSRRNRSPPRL